MWSYGGGLDLLNGNFTDIQIARCEFINNNAARSGAGVEATAQYINVSDSSFVNNSAGWMLPNYPESMNGSGAGAGRMGVAAWE